MVPISGSLVENSWSLIEADPHRGGSIALRLQVAVLTEGLVALDDFVKRLGKADLGGDGVQKLQQKDIEALLADLTEKLPEMMPGLP